MFYTNLHDGKSQIVPRPLKNPPILWCCFQFFAFNLKIVHLTIDIPIANSLCVLLELHHLLKIFQIQQKISNVIAFSWQKQFLNEQMSNCSRTVVHDLHCRSELTTPVWPQECWQHKLFSSPIDFKNKIRLCHVSRRWTSCSFLQRLEKSLFWKCSSQP